MCLNEAPDYVVFFFRFDGCVFLQIYDVPWFPYYWLKSIFQVFYRSFMIVIQDDGDYIETGLSCFIFMFHQVKTSQFTDPLALSIGDG